MSNLHLGLKCTAGGTVDHSSSLSHDIGSLFLNDEYSDVVLTVGGNKFSAHKVILAARSNYFRALLYGGLRESQQDEIAIVGANLTAFKILLKYIYTGLVNLGSEKEDVVLEILGLAHQYGFIELETAVCDYLKETLCTNNVCIIYDMASLYSLKGLSTVCEDFIDKNAPAVLSHESFMAVSPGALKSLIKRDSFCASEIQIFQAVKKWCENNSEISSEQLKEILSFIRLPLINLHDLLNEVRPTGLISPDTILDAIKAKNESRDTELQYRGYLMPGENVAVSSKDAIVLQGEMRANLLDGNTTNYDMDRGFTRHPIDDNNGQGILIKLGRQCIINHMRMLLWDKDHRVTPIFIEVLDMKDWFASRPASTTADLPKENVALVNKSAKVIEGVSRARNNLLNCDINHYNWDSGYTCHQLGSGSICIQLGQPYYISSCKLLLWDCDDRTYSYYIESSVNGREWEIVAEKTREPCRSWQTLYFSPRPIVYIKIVGTFNSANEVFHCVHFEAPAQKGSELRQRGDSSNSTTQGTLIQGQQAAAENTTQQPRGLDFREAPVRPIREENDTDDNDSDGEGKWMVAREGPPSDRSHDTVSIKEKNSDASAEDSEEERNLEENEGAKGGT
ncbi:BTB/POZ domain-containing protein 9 [Armadillidium vulgare]|nr:BTB/POZ domain-containing protein 9 [Armadillidium vulgare]